MPFPRRRLGVLLCVTSLAAWGCASESGGTPVVPSGDFQISCSRINVSTGCASAICTVSGTQGFSGRVDVSCAGQRPGVDCIVSPTQVSVGPLLSPGVFVRVSAGTNAPAGPTSLRLVGTGEGLERTTNLFDIAGRTTPANAGGMAVFGCAGYDAPPLNVRTFQSVFVGAWRGGYPSAGGTLCAERVAEAGGTFTLEIPRSCGLADGEPAYLTAGGFPACVTVPYRAGTTGIFMELYGNAAACR